MLTTIEQRMIGKKKAKCSICERLPGTPRPQFTFNGKTTKEAITFFCKNKEITYENVGAWRKCKRFKVVSPSLDGEKHDYK